MSVKFRALLVRPVGNHFEFIKTVKINRNNMVRYNKKAFIVDIKEPIYRKKKGLFYMVDVEKGQVVPHATAEQMAPELLDEVFNRKIIPQLVEGLDPKNIGSSQWIFIGLGILIGVAVGYVLGNVIPMPVR